MNSTPQTQAIAYIISPAVKAVAEYAREIVLHERAQAARHFASIGLDRCDCEDCTGKHFYPMAFYHIARKVAAQYGVA